MPSPKKSVVTPLHLLHQLSHSLIEHLEDACTQALVEAEKLLAKLEKQRGKAQEKLHKARARLQDAAEQGKAKAQAKSRSLIGDIEELLDALKARQTETRAYIAQLKRDTQESLRLAQGIGKVKEAAGKTLVAREAAQAKPAPVKSASKAKPVVSKPSARKPAAKPAASKPAATAAKPATAASKSAAKAATKASLLS